MKSSFLSLWILSALTISMAASGQTVKKKAPAPKQKATVAKPAPVAVKEKSSFDKFYERLSISYSGILTTPTLANIREGDWEQAAISPAWSEATNQGEPKEENNDTWPTNIWHQFSFSYNFGAKLSFIINPRFMTPLVNSRNMKAPEDRSFIMIDDVLVGFAGVIYSSDDKKLNLWVRPGVRMPTSRVYRATGGAGYLNHQLDLSYSLSYEYSKKIEIGLFQQLRAWIYESQYGCRNRCRLVTAPYIYYSVSDSTQLQFTFEDILETDTRSLPRGDRKEHFKDVWQNLMIGVNQKITPAFNITPFVGVYVDDTPVSDESVWFGANLAYRFK